MVKGNQPELKEQVEKLFQKNSISDQDIDIDSGHGRIETRICQVITDLKFLDGKEKWTDLKSIICVSSERCDKASDKTTMQKHID